MWILPVLCTGSGEVDGRGLKHKETVWLNGFFSNKYRPVKMVGAYFMI
jgi:hypothetical protein